MSIEYKATGFVPNFNIMTSPDRYDLAYVQNWTAQVHRNPGRSRVASAQARGRFRMEKQHRFDPLYSRRVDGLG